MAKTMWLCAIVLLLSVGAQAATGTIALDLSDFPASAITSTCSNPPANQVSERMAIDGSVPVQFTDSSGLTSVAAVSFTVAYELASVSVGSVDLQLNSEAISTPLAARSCPVTVQTFSVGDASQWVVGGQNSLQFDATDGVVDLVSRPTNLPVVVFVLTGEDAGGGSDPHIYSPHVGRQGVELVASLSHESLASRSELLASPTSLLLVDAAEASLTALLGDGSANRADAVYFTELALQVAGASSLVLYSQESDDGSDTTLAVMFDGQSMVCSRHAADVFRHDVVAANDDVVRVTVECGSQTQAYRSSRFMMRAWPFQAQAAQARVVIDSSSFRAEVFYVQQQYDADTQRWQASQPFGFFNVHTAPVNGARYTGVFGTDVGATTRAAMDSSDSTEAATAHFLASYLQ